MLHAALDLLGRGPDIADPYVLAVLALADRLAHEVLEHGAGERVGDDERRGGGGISAQGAGGAGRVGSGFPGTPGRRGSAFGGPLPARRRRRAAVDAYR